MSTINSKDFFKGGSVKIIGNENDIQQQQQEQPFARQVIRKTAGAINTVLSPIEKILSPVAELGAQLGEDIGIDKLGAKLAQQFPQAGEQLIKLEDFTKKHPEATQDVKDLFTIVSTLYPAAKGLQAAKPAIKAGAQAGLKAVAPAITKTGGVLKTAGEKTTGMAIPVGEPAAISIQAYQASKPSLFERIKNLIKEKEPLKDTNLEKPITSANTAVRLLEPGTQWMEGVAAKRTGTKLWEEGLKPALKASKNLTDMPKFLTDLKNQIIKENPVGVRREALLKAFEAFSEPYKKLGAISDMKLQVLKEDWAQFLPDAVYKGKPIAAALKEIQDMAAKKARPIIYESLKDSKGKQMYIDYGNLKSIEEWGRKNIDAMASRSFGRQIWEELVDKAITPVLTISGKVLYKTGEGLEFLGKPGAKKVGDIIK